jgi:hypothetical protein
MSGLFGAFSNLYSCANYQFIKEFRTFNKPKSTTMSSILIKKSQSFRFEYLLSFFLICFTISCIEPKRIVEQEKSTGVNSIAKKNHAEEIKPICDGKISTSINGIDIMEVNLWNSTDEDRIIISHLPKGEEIKILKDEDPYYLIETANGNKQRGYCMKEFIVMVTKRD